MDIKGTNRIKGVLELPNLKRQLVKGQSMSINDNDYWSPDVQTAIKMGFVTAVAPSRARIDSPEEKNERQVMCRNAHPRPLGLPNFAHEIAPNAQFQVKESDLSKPDIKAAIARGIIKIVGASDSTAPTEKKISFADLAKGKKAEGKKTEEKPTRNLTPAQQSLLDAQKKQAIRDQQLKELRQAQQKLDTNEEAPVPKIIDDDHPNPVRKQDNPDPRKKSVIWNPTGENPISSIKGAVVSLGDKGVVANKSKPSKLKDALRLSPDAPPVTAIQQDSDDTKQGEKGKVPVNIADSPNPAPVKAPDARQNVVVANPFGYAVTNTAKQSMVWTGEKGVKPTVKTASQQEEDEVKFVDEEQEKERIAEHPQLSKKPPQPKKDVEVITDDEMVKPHPKLGKLPPADEIDFVDE